MTVSRVLNGKAEGQVSQETMERVKAVLSECDYRPNQAARDLRRGEFSGGEEPDRTVTVLLPYPDFLEKAVPERIEDHVMIFTAAVQAAARLDAKVEMLPVSDVNDPFGIEWRRLRHLGRGSRVIAFTTWFMPVLMELSYRGCRIALISGEVFWHEVYERYTRDWALFIFMTIDGAAQATEHLLDCGCERPAAATQYAEEPEEPLTLGYLQALSRRGTAYRNIVRLRSGRREDVVGALAAAYGKDPFDSLVLDADGIFPLDYTRTLQANLGLPESVRIVQKYDDSDCLRLVPPVSAMHYPVKETGIAAVEALLAEEFKPGRRFYRGELMVRGERREDRHDRTEE